MAIFMKQFRQTVSTSGTAVQLTTSTRPTPSVIITADPTNNGTVYIGDSNVSQSSRTGQPVGASESLDLESPAQFGTEETLDLTKIWIDATSDGDSVIISYFDRDGGG